MEEGGLEGVVNEDCAPAVARNDFGNPQREGKVS